MSITIKCKPLPLIFYLIGIAPLHPDSFNNRRNVSRSIAATISSIAILVAVTLLAYITNVFLELGNFNAIINNISLSTASILCFTSIYQCYYHRLTFQALTDQINKIQMNFSTESLQNSFITTFAKNYKRKVACLFTTLFASTTLASYVLWSVYGVRGFIMVLAQAVINTFAGFIVTHCILYVDTVQMFSRLLNRQIRDLDVSMQDLKKIRFLKYVKSMHMDLWILVNKVNEFFSWTIFFFITNFTIYVVYDIFLILPMLQAKWDIPGIAACFCALSYDAGCVILLVNASHFCAAEAFNFHESIEDFTFWPYEDYQLHGLKHQLLDQINNFPILIQVGGSFIVNREHLAMVVATCCTYVIICIQFFSIVDE